MENQKTSGYDFIQVNNSLLDTNEKLNKELSEDTKKTLLSIIDNFLLDISLQTSKLTLYSLVNNNRSITMELFSQNIEEYIYFTVAQSVTTSYNIGFENAIREICEVLIKTQNGLILNNSEPYDLKFQLKNGEEYCIDIKSVNHQNTSSKQTYTEHKERAEKAGKIYKLCLYDDESLSEEDYLLKGNEFWNLIAGFDNAKATIFRIINGAANKLSVSTIIRDTKNRFISEWRLQD